MYYVNIHNVSRTEHMVSTRWLFDIIISLLFSSEWEALAGSSFSTKPQTFKV